LEPVSKSGGLTATERHLALLGEKSFLSLWSYPNVYKSRGKELCDLLVVCGDDILIFSDKSTAWPEGSTDVAWARWYRKTILKSVDQVVGAMRWINEFGNRLYLDAACSQRLPLQLPPLARRRVHGIVVASGAAEACKSHFGGGNGSLMLARSAVHPDRYATSESAVARPFEIGDVNPEGAFIHVLTDFTLDVLARELDTVTDFTEYLRRKEAFFRSPRFSMAAGEEELIAYYLTHMDNGVHDFSPPGGRSWKEGGTLLLEEGLYSELQSDRQYIEKKRADEKSYLWDELIGAFAKNIMAGTTVDIDGSAMTLQEHEQGVRLMAQETRFKRRSYSEGILDALGKGREAPRFCRAMIPPEGRPDSETGFFFVTVAIPEFLEGDYAKYRIGRFNTLYAYAMGFLKKFKYLKRIVGIATEPVPKQRSDRTSEDLVYAEAGDRSEEWEAETDKLCADVGVLQERNRQVETHFTVKEWPTIETRRPPALGNRKARRERASKMRHQSK
jgi:hypothetical protein